MFVSFLFFLFSNPADVYQLYDLYPVRHKTNTREIWRNLFDFNENSITLC